MRQQTKPFIVEIKQSRKSKPTDRKTSIWGKLELTLDQDIEREAPAAPTAAEDNTQLQSR
ncbi:hypothetical protein HGP17_32325 [Rhizobium sp. P38BS-XIX]|uniref:hypothetical protein n=1 Tax=Rhizobium sp. P38BS-XIX TaxID=2726740 RepID=UPI0014576160|nr:hypothetical protein [Rhizobium sp. P38BS-XIX]NLS01545.1 hypothetical protein [Rhizobium sp. P38BS-XIX]